MTDRSENILVPGTYIWVVAQGEYSDYRVLAACTSEQEAKKLAERVSATDRYDSAGIESLIVVSGDVQRESVLYLSVEILDDGTEANAHERMDASWPWQSAVPLDWRWVRAPYIKHRGGRLNVHGTNHRRVRKVYSDQRAMLLSDDAYRAREEMTGTR